jgi:hypothetical protein
MRNSLKIAGRMLFLAPLLLGVAAPEAPSAWHVQRVTEGGVEKCRMESDKVPVNDGYQNVTVQMLVTSGNVVQIVSQSPFDVTGSDIGVEVDKNAFVKMDKLQGEKMAVFEGASAATLVPQFKAGLRARAQLRFWPTWPATGSHNAEFSLIGFTKASEEMSGNCH